MKRYKQLSSRLYHSVHYIPVVFFIVKKTDKFSLVTYNNRVKVDFHLADMHRANKDRFKAVIRELTAENRTDLCGGLVKGNLPHSYSLLTRSYCCC